MTEVVFRILSDFFVQHFEREINEKMLEYSYKFEYEKVKRYIDSLISIEIEDYLNYLVENYNVHYLEASDVIQMSNFDDCTRNICSVIKAGGDKGFNILQVGKLLENDGVIRKDGAYKKYGENQAKTAEQLGLLHSLSGQFFLTCLGYIISDYSEKKQKQLYTRLLLRNKTIRRLLYKSIIKGKASFVEETSGLLSQSTVKRRQSSMKKLLKYLLSTEEYDFSKIISNIDI